MTRDSMSAVRFNFLFLLLFVATGCGMNVSNSTQNSPSQTHPSASINYVALGDSTGVGVGARDGGYVGRVFKMLEQHTNSPKLTNLCVSGATSGDIVRSQLDSGIRARPDLVTVGIGINDIGHNVPVESFITNLEMILTRLKNETTARIVVTNIPDISTSTRIPVSFRPQYQRQIINFNQKLEELARKHGVVVFDIFSITREELPDHPEYFSSDGFHPSDLGYQLWADKMWPTVAQTVGIKN